MESIAARLGTDGGSGDEGGWGGKGRYSSSYE
jgi:hypothetical protein